MQKDTKSFRDQLIDKSVSEKVFKLMYAIHIIGNCKKCRFQRNPASFNRGCGWYKAPENAWMNIPNEVAALKNKIRNKEEQDKRFYIKNKPWIAE